MPRVLLSSSSDACRGLVSTNGLRLVRPHGSGPRVHGVNRAWLGPASRGSSMGRKGISQGTYRVFGGQGLSESELCGFSIAPCSSFRVSPFSRVVCVFVHWSVDFVPMVI